MYVLMVRTRSALPIYGISSPLICFLNSFSVSQPRVWFCKKKTVIFTANTTTAQSIKRGVCLMVVGRGCGRG